MKPSVSAIVRPSADAYAGLADLNMIGVFFWDADGHITNANDRFLQTARCHGATFRVYLPRSNASPQPEIVAPVAAVAARGSETVLLVEDEDGVRRLAQRILENAGYRVIPASDPAEAMELFALHRGGIDLVLTDVIMPGSSGPDLFQSLAAQEPTLKVLYMSGYTEDAVVRQAGLDRGQPFVHKPFTAAVLARTVREAFSHPGARPAPVIE